LKTWATCPDTATSLAILKRLERRKSNVAFKASRRSMLEVAGTGWWLTERMAAQAVSVACAAREISNNVAEANAMPAER
jgi:hypothetical protein